MHVLILGSGGREHALVWAISRSPLKPTISIAPGNAGTARLGENVDVDIDEHQEVVDFCAANEVDLVVVGPEAPLFDGIADSLRAKDIRVFGPGAEAAMLESSKVFGKEFCSRFGIPTPDYEVFSKPDHAHKYIDKCEKETFVVKADGPAAGKGAFVCDDPIDAHAAVDTCMIDRKFGEAGRQVIIEDRLEGFETTLLTLVAGNKYIKLPYSQDHKRAFDNNKGPNTGGMGVFAPTPKVDSALDHDITQGIVAPTIEGLASSDIQYWGCLYFGLMVTEDGPYLIEYNCRFGDPEAEAVLPLLEGDFLGALSACADGNLRGVALKPLQKKAVAIILASKGYPEKYRRGIDLTSDILALEKNKDLVVFHAGTKQEGKKILSNGGRVLAVTSTADSFQQARSAVYDAVGSRPFEGLFYRKDIGRELEEARAD